MSVLTGNGNAGTQWVAWPSPGYFPIQAVSQSWTSIDDTGWSLQSDVVDLTGATVLVTEDGQPRPVKTTTLLQHYGSTTALMIMPQGWRSRAGSTYKVTVVGADMPVEYEVTMVDCS